MRSYSKEGDLLSSRRFGSALTCHLAWLICKDGSPSPKVSDWSSSPLEPTITLKSSVDYVAALANEGGGTIILGVTDKRPRRVVGTAAFSEPGRTVAGLGERLPLKVVWSEILHPNGRVLVFSVPSRPLGLPIQSNGVYWARSGDALKPLTPQELRHIFDEAGPDYSAELHSTATVSDLDPVAIARFRQAWRRKSGNSAIESLTDRQLLEDAELTVDGRITIAALILLGTRQAFGRHLSQAEVVFEYRSSEASIEHQQRLEFRQGFLLYLDELWSTINLRNEVLHYRDGLFMIDVPVFNEAVVDLSRFLRQPVKTQNPSNGELSHGIVT